MGMTHKKRVAIVTCATKSYVYAIEAFMRAVSRNIYHLKKHRPDEYEIKIIFVGDSEAWSQVEPAVEVMFGNQSAHDRVCDVDHFVGDWTEGKNYKPLAQHTIAQMRTKTFELSRRWDADFCWSLDSDVLPPDHALLCSLQMLEFDGGYYSIACCPYPSQGGGSFLTGRGTRFNTILPDFDFEERDVPEDVAKEWTDLCAEVDADPENVELARKRYDMMKQIEKTCPPKYGGNIWKLNAEHGWRRRGWFDFAYPAIGRGAVVPTDWCGFGCTLLNSEALSVADFTGYDGAGTEDLFVVWKRWFPRGLKLCSIPHCPCDHVVRTGGDKRKIVHVHAYHEEHEETKDHLRRENRPFYQHHVGEEHDDANDGVPAIAEEDKSQEVESPTGQKRRRKLK